MKYSEKLKARYKSEVESGAIWAAMDRADYETIYIDHDAYIVASCYGGSIQCTYPSGKIYAPWTTNQTAKDVIRDTAFQESLEEVAESHGCYVTSGEGSADDIFVCRSLGEAYENYISTDGGDTFTYENKTYPAADVLDNMNLEKHWPDAFAESNGELRYLDFVELVCNSRK